MAGSFEPSSYIQLILPSSQLPRLPADCSVVTIAVLPGATWGIQGLGTTLSQLLMIQTIQASCWPLQAKIMVSLPREEFGAARTEVRRGHNLKPADCKPHGDALTA